MDFTAGDGAFLAGVDQTGKTLKDIGPMTAGLYRGLVGQNIHRDEAALITALYVHALGNHPPGVMPTDFPRPKSSS